MIARLICNCNKQMRKINSMMDGFIIAIHFRDFNKWQLTPLLGALSGEAEHSGRRVW